MRVFGYRRAMPAKFDPGSLFVRYRHPRALVPARSLSRELARVAARTKAVYFTGYPIACFERGERELGELLRIAARDDLSVVLRPRTSGECDVFVLPIDQSWRVAAHDALLEAALDSGERWSAAAEAHQSLLLGYSKAQRRQWLAYHAQLRAAWGGKTVYALLTVQQRSRVEDVARRCFGPRDTLGDLRLFYHAGRELVRRDAHRQLPRGTTLARVGLTWRAHDALFGRTTPRNRAFRSIAITDRRAPIVAGGLMSDVQFLTARGWR